jgi:hypothetical protein
LPKPHLSSTSRTKAGGKTHIVVALDDFFLVAVDRFRTRRVRASVVAVDGASGQVLDGDAVVEAVGTLG